MKDKKYFMLASHKRNEAEYQRRKELVETCREKEEEILTALFDSMTPWQHEYMKSLMEVHDECK